MGIRIHKIMGWGIRDLKKKDPRLHPAGVYDSTDKWCNTTPEKFVEWVKEHREEVLVGLRREYAHTAHTDADIWKRACFSLDLYLRESKRNKTVHYPAQALIHESECANPAVLVLIPPSMQDKWYRCDDAIDYSEAPANLRSKVVSTPHMQVGLFPWAGTMIRVRRPELGTVPKEFMESGRKCDKYGPLALEGGWYNLLVGEWDRGTPAYAKGKALKHFKEDFRARVPDEVIALLYWLDISPDPLKLIDDLRPMIYTYWA